MKPDKRATGKPAGTVAPKTRKRAATAALAPTLESSTGLAVVDESALLTDLRRLIGSARQRIATQAFATQTLLCWHLGRQLLSENLQGARAENGKQILVTVSRDLAAEYGLGFSYAELARMVELTHSFPDEAIVVTLSQQLSWSRFHALLPIKEPLHRAIEHVREGAACDGSPTRINHERCAGNRWRTGRLGRATAAAADAGGTAIPAGSGRAGAQSQP